MIILITVVLLVSTCTARPNVGIDTQNVVTVPPNCPDGQEWVNGQCREIWRAITAAPPNVVTVPTNCPTGQEWVNGQCREIWRAITAAPPNVVTVPTNCPTGQEWVNGQCREIWRAVTAEPINVVTVPTNCPPGQEYVNGQCREIWARFASEQRNPNSPNALNTFFDSLREILSRQERSIDSPATVFRTDSILNNKNVINVPNQCPVGYRPDALGVCRPIL